MTCVNISGCESAREEMEMNLERLHRRSIGASSGGERMWRIWREFGFIELSQRCTVPPSSPSSLMVSAWGQNLNACRRWSFKGDQRLFIP